MVDLATRMISIGDKTEPIKEFSVWFRTPIGIHDTLDAALKIVAANDWPIQGVVLPVSVAVGSTLYEEIGRL